MSSWWSASGTEGEGSSNERDIKSHDDDQDFTSSPPPVSSGAHYMRLQVPRRIHVIGTGGVGKFIAHSLRGLPDPPPVTLLFHRESKLKAWRQSAKQLQLNTEGVKEARTGYDAELALPTPRYHGEEHDALDKTESERTGEPIHTLVLAVKATQVVSALSAVKHRLDHPSTVLFLQNGMGIIDEVNETVFPDSATRPHYMIGINTHGITNAGDFTASHAGFGTLSLGLLPHEYYREQSTPKWHNNPSTSRYLLRTLTRSPVLCATPFVPSELLLLQLEKLAINAIINPLTVLLDARNGSVLYNYHLTRVMRLLLSEISLVIRSLPEIAQIPNITQRFSPGRLETIVCGVAEKTKDNISSMLQDVRGGRRTEIDYINGYIVKRGEALGLRPAMNYLIMQLVQGKQQLIGWESAEELPLVGEDKIVLNDKQLLSSAIKQDPTKEQQEQSTQEELETEPKSKL